MNAKEEFERIKKKYKETLEINLEYKGKLIELPIEFFYDMGTLIDIIDVMDKKAKQDSIHKVQLSSLYGEHKEIYKNVDISIDTSNGYFKDENVDIKITDKFVIIRNKEYQRFYNINEIEYFSIKESEVK